MIKEAVMLKESTRKTIEELCFSHFGVSSWDEVKYDSDSNLDDFEHNSFNHFINFLEEKYEIPLSIDQEEGKDYDERLLKRVSSAISDITTQPWW